MAKDFQGGWTFTSIELWLRLPVAFGAKVWHYKTALNAPQKS
jgi:hypothetical protein